MKRLPVNPAANPTPEALAGFLEQCRSAASSSGVPQLVSISLAVEDLDPLAVLESIFEPGELHFYAERPSSGFAVAGAEAVLSFTAEGPERFARARRHIEGVLANSLAVGPVDSAFAGPHFFLAGGFFDRSEPGAPFPPLRVFVPRWQVSRSGDDSIAVANLVVSPDADVASLAGRVLKAHGKFSRFDYRAATGAGVPAHIVREETAEDERYREAVRSALAEIAQGRYRKVVLARSRVLTGSEAFHPLGVLNRLRQRFPGCYAFSIGNGAGAAFIGASPERLVRVVSGRFHTEAVAGSAPRGTTASEDAALARALLASDKDRREHQLVLDSIGRRLADLGIVLEHAAQPRLLGLANVQHLHTPVSAVLPPDVHLLDLVQRLHPTPAVGGTPREEALDAIRRLEDFPRGLYAGPLGWCNWRGEGEFLVALRSALVEGSTARAYAGAGIVAGSDPGKEFAETELKFEALVQALVPR